MVDHSEIRYAVILAALGYTRNKNACSMEPVNGWPVLSRQRLNKLKQEVPDDFFP
jgi:hypothetical protein